MNDSRPVRLLLGPQRPVRNLAEARERAGLPGGPYAVVSAGWQEAEADIDDVRQIIGLELDDLRLYQRAEAIMREDDAIASAYRTRQDRLKDQQRLYRLRLKQLAIAAGTTLRATGEKAMVAAEQRHAISQLRALDRHHLHRTETLHREFEGDFSPANHAALARQRDEVGEVIARCNAVLITGGNVIVLLNRLRLFGLADLLDDKPIIAWSAGAMVLADRIVLFHDRAPEGPRDAELLGAGMGLIPGYVFLPDVRHRLKENDRLRSSLLSRRFSPDVTVALDSGSALWLDDTGIAGAESVRRIRRGGRFGRLRAA